MIAVSALTSMTLDRTGYRIPMAIGFLILAISIFALGFSPQVLSHIGLSIPDFWWLSALIFLSGAGIGMASPSSNNAAIELLPDKIAAISGLRGMFRQTGGVMGTVAIVLVLTRSENKVSGFHVVFLGMAVLLILAIPFIMAVPDGRRKGLDVIYDNKSSQR